MAAESPGSDLVAEASPEVTEDSVRVGTKLPSDIDDLSGRSNSSSPDLVVWGGPSELDASIISTDERIHIEDAIVLDNGAIPDPRSLKLDDAPASTGAGGNEDCSRATGLGVLSGTGGSVDGKPSGRPPSVAVLAIGPSDGIGG